jgi:flavin reductase (DIM6/NTAB) family NADH-FMN oxidoreductase RutF
LSSPTLAVHYLQPSNRDLARLFGGTTGSDTDKFAECSWTVRPSGSLILDDVNHWWVGLAINRVSLGDHVGILLEPLEVHDAGGLRQLHTSDLGTIEPAHPREPA